MAIHDIVLQHPICKGHNVFISFRGADVRHTFVSRLHPALRREGVTSFADHDLPRGEHLKKAISREIGWSRFSLVVLSRDYASSEWCLDELVTIMRCCSRAGHVAIPIFYHLSPEELSGGCYREDLDRHKSRYTYNRVDGWLRALAWITHISGWVVPAGGQLSEALFVKKIARTMGQKVQKLAPVVRVLQAGDGRNSIIPHIVTVGATMMLVVIVGKKWSVAKDMCVFIIRRS